MTGDSETITEILRVLRADADDRPLAAIEVGEPIPLDSEDDALDSPVGIEEIKTIAECVTVVATSGTAVTILIERVVRLIKQIGAKVQIMNQEGEQVEISLDSSIEKIVKDLVGPEQ